VNPAAGGGRAGAIWAKVERQLRHSGTSVQQVLTNQPAQTRQLAQHAVARFDTLVAVGGDGTVSEVAEGILAAGQKATALGIVPCGTGNDVARALGIRTAADSISALARGKPCAIDVIEIRFADGGKTMVKHALQFAAVGIISELLKLTSDSLKRRFGPGLAYRLGLMRALWRYEPQPMRVTCDGQNFEERLLLACASNAETAGAGIRLAPGARLDDGLLNVNLVAAVSRWEALKQLRALGQGQHIAYPKVRYLTAGTLNIETDFPVKVAADGDLVGHTPASFEVKPKALQVVA